MKSLMMLLFSLLLCASLSAAKNDGPRAGPAKPSLMPAARAKATFDDVRVKTFMAFVSKELGGKCRLPDPGKTLAIPPPPASIPPGVSPDFVSSIYEIQVPCPGNQGLSSITIRAEFVPIENQPLDLTLSLLFRK